MDLTPFEDAGYLDPAARDADDIRATLEYLSGLGVSTEALLDAFRGDTLHSAGVDLLLSNGEVSAREVADELGIDVAEVVDTYRLVGVHLTDPDARILLADEADLLRVLVGVAGTFEEGEADEILRTTSAALTTIAESIVSVFVGGVEDRIEVAQRLSWRERTELTQLTGEQAVHFGRSLGYFFRHHLREAIVRQRVSMADASDRRLRRMTIGFVDLVGFTPMSATMSATDLVRFIGEFESRSYDIASRAGGRIVKIIGDEVMVSALDLDTGCEIVLGLLDEFRTGDTAPRGGIATGEVVARLGDFFGPVVNLASRLVDEAVPGELLVAADAAEGMGSHFAHEPAGRRMLKGFADPVAVVSVSVSRRS